MRHYYVTLTSANVAYNLKSLVQAIDPDYVDTASYKVSLQSAKGNTGDIFLGSSSVTQSAYGKVLLAAGDSYDTGIGLEDAYALPDTNAQALGILLD